MTQEFLTLLLELGKVVGELGNAASKLGAATYALRQTVHLVAARLSNM